MISTRYLIAKQSCFLLFEFIYALAHLIENYWAPIMYQALFYSLRLCFVEREAIYKYLMIHIISDEDQYFRDSNKRRTN